MYILNKIQTNTNWINNYTKPLVIAGPCSAESEEQIMNTAIQLKSFDIKVFRAGIWKPRTKPGFFEGVGSIGLKWLQKVKKKTGMMVAVEVANSMHVKLAIEYDIDILWIGARSTGNPFTIQEIAESLQKTNKIILVKNPINPDIDLWIGALERLINKGIKNIGVIHRGFSPYKKSKYRNQPNWELALKFKNKYTNIPMICDPSHICGERTGIINLIQKALYLQYNGIMIESHFDPDKALSDSNQQIRPLLVLEIIKIIKHKYNSNNSYKNKLLQLRSQIEEIDYNIFSLFYQRFNLVKKIGKLKKDNNIAVFQPEHWNLILEKLEKFNEQIGISKQFTSDLLKLIHKESINIQNDIIMHF
jgi:chorismate mutase